MPHRPASPVRLFVGAYPPAASVEGMLAAMSPLDLPPGRQTPAEQVHLTLAFLGDTPARHVDQVAESVARSAAGLSGFMLTPRRLITLPERGRPRLLAMETDAPAVLLELVRRLAVRLLRHPRPKPAGRFCPHLTLCRFEHGVAEPARIDRAVELDPFLIGRVALVRSVLRPGGAEHREIASTALGPAGQ
jgi:2'-5' RNA ligase